MKSVQFIVPGRPVPKGRPRVTRHGTYTPKSTQQFEAAVRAAWEKSGAAPFGENEPLDLRVWAYFPIPKATPKRSRKAMALAPHLKRGDLDNIVKSVMDALNGYAYPDDAAIWSIEAYKLYAMPSQEAYTTVMLRRTEEDAE